MFRLPSLRSRHALGAVTLAVSLGLASLFAATATAAGPGYQLDSTKATITLNGEAPSGIAVDQASQTIYVAEASKSLSKAQPGQVEQLNSSGVPSGKSPFGTGGEDIFGGVAVNPVTQGVYAYQAAGSTPIGEKGVSKMSLFSSAGALLNSFAPTNSKVGSLAADSSGRVFFPNTTANTVQVFSSTGTLEATVTCTACTGGAFKEPSSVALDSAANLYVVDRAGAGRVTKFALSGGSYVYQSVLVSGGEAVAVGVDPSTNDVFVGSNPSLGYHVTAYTSAGTEFDDFATGLVSGSVVPINAQLAANSTTHRLYLSDPGGSRLWIFERVATIPAPVAAVLAPTSLGQVEATLRGSVDPEGHVLSSCRFEYTDHADFLANGYANAKKASCPAQLGSTESTPIAAPVTGLAAATTYDYRVLAASHGGSGESGNQEFATLPALPPEVVTEAASSVAKTTATLAGTVNPKGGVVSDCHFEYVDEAHFQQSGFVGAAVSACPGLPSGSAAKAVSVSVAGLSAGTGYRFRLVATSNSGTTAAPDRSLTTVAETCATNPALCPPASPPASPPPATPPSAPPAPTPQPKPLKCRKGFKKKTVNHKPKCVKVKKAQHKR